MTWHTVSISLFKQRCLHVNKQKPQQSALGRTLWWRSSCSHRCSGLSSKSREVGHKMWANRKTRIRYNYPYSKDVFFIYFLHEVIGSIRTAWKLLWSSFNGCQSWRFAMKTLRYAVQHQPSPPCVRMCTKCTGERCSAYAAIGGTVWLKRMAMRNLMTVC